MTKYHVEIIKVINDSFSAFCRIYAFDSSGTIRQVINIKLSYFHTGKSIIVDSPGEYCRCIVLDDKLLIKGLGENDIIIAVDSARTTSFNSHDSIGGDVRSKTSILKKGSLTYNQECIINLENRKLKGIIL